MTDTDQQKPPCGECSRVDKSNGGSLVTSDRETGMAPSTCDLHVGGKFTNGIAGGMFYLCGCVWDDSKPNGPWHRGVCQDERPLILAAQRAQR